MKPLLITLSSMCLFALTSVWLYAATIEVVAPEKSSLTGESFPVVVTLDPEGETVSGIEGSLSFDESVFTIDSISTDNSVVSPWIRFPHVSTEKYFDGRVHITFEGIFAGGFGGVKSPYYKGEKEGVVFTVFLRPKSTGEATLILDSLSLRAYNEEATEIPVLSTVKKITVPVGTRIHKKENKPLRFIRHDSLTVMVAKSDLINNGALHIVVDDKEPHSAISEMYVAETETYDGVSVEERNWHKAANPYILVSQDRSKYIHVKVIYSDDTYTIKTIEPVDNLQSYQRNSHILISIGMLIVAFCLYVYTRKYTILPSAKT